MIDLDQIIIKLTGNAEAMDALMHTVTEEQANWSLDASTWSMKQVIEHLYNEERIDFRRHLQEVLSNPPLTWGSLPGGKVPINDHQQGFEDFLTERHKSLQWLHSLGSVDWNSAFPTAHQPEGNTVKLNAGDVLVSWVAHDYLHLRQMIELVYAWQVKQAAPYSVDYGGEW